MTSQSGVLRVVQDGTVLSNPALDLIPTVCADGERGLLGIAVDPAFASNNFLYLYGVTPFLLTPQPETATAA